jgi:hypothetical protein
MALISSIFMASLPTSLKMNDIAGQRIAASSEMIRKSMQEGVFLAGKGKRKQKRNGGNSENSK